MSKMSELHYNIITKPQEDDPEIEYYMKYGGKKGRWIPTIEQWYNKFRIKPMVNKKNAVALFWDENKKQGETNEVK